MGSGGSAPSGDHPAAAQADLKKRGITDKLIPVNQGDYHGKYLDSLDAARREVWDISEPGWYGDNGRAVIEPLSDGRTYGPDSTDFGDYNNPDVNALIEKALAATGENAAASYWHAAIVPFQTRKTASFRSSRVHNAISWPSSQAYDVTRVWLNPAS